MGLAVCTDSKDGIDLSTSYKPIVLSSCPTVLSAGAISNKDEWAVWDMKHHTHSGTTGFERDLDQGENAVAGETSHWTYANRHCGDSSVSGTRKRRRTGYCETRVDWGLLRGLTSILGWRGARLVIPVGSCRAEGGWEY